jgi:protein-tyrosine phosphatase
LWEREPNRRITLLNDPKFLSLSEEEQEKMFPVSNRECELLLNNNIIRFDPNFVADLLFNKLGDYPIYIGPYPQNGKDIETLNKTGITAVINLQSDVDHLHRQINWQENLKAYAQHNIEVRRFPIQDFSSEDLVKNLKGSGDLLNELLKKNQVVYVHCTAGMSRAAAAIIIYLYYYQYMSFEDAYNLVKQHRSIICPNVGAIKQVIKNNERKEVSEHSSSHIKEEETKKEKEQKEEKVEEVQPKEEVTTQHKKKKKHTTSN